MIQGPSQPISRRRFLAYSAAALALPACAPLARRDLLAANEAPEPQFYVPSPRFYLNLDQDFSAVKYDRVLPAPAACFPADHRTHLTVIGARSGKMRQISLPGLVHSVLADPEAPVMVPTDGQPWLYSLDAKTLELAAFVQLKDGEFPFAGHAVSLPGGEHFAITTNSRRVGHYDRVSIRERRTLREVANFCSYGFEAHDLKVSADGKSLYVGHYGSLLGSGPYAEFSRKDLKGLMQKAKAYTLEAYSNIYPACVAVIDLANGKLLDRLSSVDGGPHCHFAVGTEGRIYLPHRPSRLRNRADTLTNPQFREGVHGNEHMKDFVPRMQAGFGTSIAFDAVNREVLIPSRWVETTNYLSEDAPDDFRTVDLKPNLPKMEKTHGLAFHPDGRHYVITGNNWLAALERKTHRFVPELSFPVPLFLHAHTSVA